VNCESLGLSLAFLAPLPGDPQRKSLNSSEKFAAIFVRESPCQKPLANGAPNEKLAEIFSIVRPDD
jgi:hypothetical protein